MSSIQNMNEHSPLILAIDEGTSNAKAVLVNQLGQVVARGSRPLRISHPQAGYSEQDPLLIWQATLEAIAEPGQRGTRVAVHQLAVPPFVAAVQ